MSRDDQSHLPLTSAHERRLRDDSGSDGANVIGYVGPDGAIMPVGGDRKFPFVMVPPDLGQVASYVRTATSNPFSQDLPILSGDVTDAAALTGYARGEAIDVRGVRHLSFYLSLLLPASAGNEPSNNMLSIIPQVANSGITLTGTDGYKGSDAPPNTPGQENLLWHSISVINPVLLGAFPTPANPATALGAPTYALRNAHMTELALPYPERGPLPATGVEYHTVLVFDVAPYEFFRLLWARSYMERPVGTFAADNSNSPERPFFSLHFQGQR